MGRPRVSIDQVRTAFSEVEYSLLSEEYVGNKGPLEFRCSRGHLGTTTWSRFKQGHRCSACSGLKKKTLDDVKTAFLSAGYTLLSGVYTSAHSHNLQYRCSEGHINTTSWNYFQRGYRCPECFRNFKHTVSEVQDKLSAEGYTLQSETYTTNKEELSVLCPKKHESQIRLGGFVASKGCGECSGLLHASSAEEDISGFIVSKLGGDSSLVIRNDRVFLRPQELDIFVPSKNFAIEYCDLALHSEVGGKKPNNYHYNKMVACNKKGVRLMTIFEDEYKNRPEVVLSRIQNAIGTPDVRVFARELIFSVVLKEEYNRFVEAHHLQGNTLSKYRFGLYTKDRLLVAVQSYGSVARAHTNKNIPGRVIEMKRMATLPGYSVVGGASKLFKHACRILKAEGYTHVKSYCDMRYASLVPVYESLGFKLLTFTKYTPHYIRDGRRVRNQGLRKTPEDRLTGKTEWQLRCAEGYDRMFDTGHRTYLFSMG